MSYDPDFKFTGDEPEERITRICNAALQCMQEHPEFLADDKLAVMICNGVSKSDWDRVEFGCGFYNMNSPREAIMIVIQHAINMGEQYGINVGVMEPTAVEVHIVRSKRSVFAELDDAIRKAMKERERNAEGTSGTD